MKPGQIYKKTGGSWADFVIIGDSIAKTRSNVTLFYLPENCFENNNKYFSSLRIDDEWFIQNYILVDDKEEQMKLLLEIS
jgi:hypothetical protein